MSDLLETVLSPDEHEAVVLKLHVGLTLQEIADIRGVSINTVASWYRRGLTRLKNRLTSSANAGCEEEPHGRI